MDPDASSVEMARLWREMEERIAAKMRADQRGEAFVGLEPKDFGWRPTAIVPDGMPSQLRRK